MGKFDNLKPIEVKGGTLKSYVQLSAVAKLKFQKTQEIRSKIFDSIKGKTSRRYLGILGPKFKGDKAKMLWNAYRRNQKEGADKFNAKLVSNAKALGYSTEGYKKSAGIAVDLPQMIDDLTAHFQDFFNRGLPNVVALAKNSNYQPTVADLAPPAGKDDSLAARAKRGKRFAKNILRGGLADRAISKHNKDLDDAFHGRAPRRKSN